MPVSTSVVSSGPSAFVSCDQICSTTRPSPSSASSSVTTTAAAIVSASFPPTTSSSSSSSSGPGVTGGSGLVTTNTIPISIVEKSSFYRSGTKQLVRPSVSQQTFSAAPAVTTLVVARTGRIVRKEANEEDPSEPPRKKHHPIKIINNSKNEAKLLNQGSSGTTDKSVNVLEQRVVVKDLADNSLRTVARNGSASNRSTPRVSSSASNNKKESNNSKPVVKLQLAFPSIEDEEADCDPDHCECGECETDSLFGDGGQEDYCVYGENDCVSSSDRKCKVRAESELEDWNNNDTSSNCSTTVHEDDDLAVDEDDDDDSTGAGRREVIPCIHCQVGKDHSKAENLIWPVRLDIDLIETLFQLCPEFFEDFDEVEMDPMELANTPPLFDDPNQTCEYQPSSSSTSSSSSNTTTATSSCSNSFATTSPSASAVTEFTDRKTIQDSQQAEQPEPSPPNVQVDDSPLQPSMDRNKESLKVKLLLRRPMNQLVEQGILPPPKTPAAFAGQRVRLERARMGDLLKVKILQRPARQELVRQHILEDSNARVAPSLAEKQRMLKRARLADSLNDHLIHRPGPLELVRKNILHAPDAQIEQAIKEGVVEFKPTSEGHTPGPQVPNIYLCGEDESSSDLSSPAGTLDQSVSQNSADSSSSSFTKKEDESPQCTGGAVGLVPSSPSLGSTTSTLSPVSMAAFTPPPPPPPPLPSAPPILGRLQIHLQNIQAAAASGNVPISSAGTIPVTSAELVNQFVSSSGTLVQPIGTCIVSSQGVTSFSQPQQQPSSSKSRSSKKSSKTKSQPKARTIKFHEYKGPPSAQKGGNNQNQQQQVESSYELLLQQQQLFLQWQLEWQHKYPQIILPAVSKLNPTGDAGQTKIAPTGVPMTLQSNGSSRNGTLISPAPISFTPATTQIPISPAMASQSKQQPIAPAPPPAMSTSTTSATTTITIPVQNPVPMQISVSDIKPKPASVSDTNTTSPPSSTTPNTASNPVTTAKIKLNDWKVSDLKAELKRRNLPVSGSKPQLVERLRQADSNVQDEAVSTTTPPPKGNVEDAGTGKQSTTVNRVVIKTEIDENSSSNDPMDVSEPSTDAGTTTNNNYNNNNNVGKTVGKQGTNKINSPQVITSSQAAAENGINVKLTLIGNNAQAMCTDINKNNPDNKANVDENLIREQQKQIEQLQQALKNSQHQLQQMKSSQITGGQKHRIALQQHLQQKMQQQALQAQLQKLIQLHSIQQQQQQQQQQQKVIQIAQMTTPTVPLTVQAQHPQSAIKVEDSSSSLGRNDDGSKGKQGGGSSPATTVGLMTSAIQIQQPQQQQVPKIPFTIVKLSTIPSKTVATATATIPTLVQDIQQQANTQIVLTHAPTVVATATDSEKSFQVQSGGTDSNRQEGPRWTTQTETANSDSMDHSWLLKINEVPASETGEEIPKNVSDFIVTFDDSTQIKNTAKDTVKESGASKKEGVKSQMVDDVLEILIRSGELPPSAAQEPQTPTTPGKTPQILPYSTPASALSNRENAGITVISTDSSGSAGVVPPPPPLPPATFAVTLPTSMTFSRNPNAISAPVPSCGSSFTPLITTTMDLNSAQSPGTPSILDMLQESNSSSPLPSGSKLTIPKRPNSYFSHHKEPLSKEAAADILKISNDLSNFGRVHAENEKLAAAAAAAALSDSLKLTNKFHHHNTLPDVVDDDSNSLSLLLGVDKDLHLVDDMDVVLDDGTSHDLPHHESNMRKNMNSNPGLQVPMAVDSQNHSSTRMKNEEDLLDELGLLHSDLDVPMPMEMDYADWLDNLLPNNCNNPAVSNALQSHQQQSHHNQSHLQQQLQPSSQHHQSQENAANPCGDLSVNFSNNNGLTNENCNSFFGISSMDYCNPASVTESNNVTNQNQASMQRDPLLSSARTLDIFSAANVQNGMNNSVVPGFGVMDSSNAMGLVADLKASNGAPMSPMSDSLLWDFAI